MKASAKRFKDYRSACAGACLQVLWSSEYINVNRIAKQSWFVMLAMAQACACSTFSRLWRNVMEDHQSWHLPNPTVTMTSATYADSSANPRLPLVNQRNTTSRSWVRHKYHYATALYTSTITPGERICYWSNWFLVPGYHEVDRIITVKCWTPQMEESAVSNSMLIKTKIRINVMFINIANNLCVNRHFMSASGRV